MLGWLNKMTLSEKLKSLQVKQLSRFVRAESIKDGKVIVSDVFDTSLWTIANIERDVARRTLALVSPMFRIVISNIDGGAVTAPPSITIGGYATKCRLRASISLGG